MKEITNEEFRINHKDAYLVDVREAYEHEAGNLGGVNIPMSELQHRAHEIPKEGDVVLYCRSGARSSYAIQILSQNGWENLINLQGGTMSTQ
jgi:rhodanese-related sulfurtransferase